MPHAAIQQRVATVAAWTADDSDAALAEGWDIFLTERDDRDTFEIQAWNDFDGVTFGSDRRALAHVIASAASGNVLHQRALAHVAAIDPLSFAIQLADLIEDEDGEAFRRGQLSTLPD